MSETEIITTSEQGMTVKEFLEKSPPTANIAIKKLATRSSSSPNAWLLVTPYISLHCEHSSCGGVRVFSPDAEKRYVAQKHWGSYFLTYTCRNCQKTYKRYAVTAILTTLPNTEEADGSGQFYKYGEFPAFGPSTPPRVISLIGPDKDYYLKGRRAENQGLGVGAFAYYRRVVEDQKNRLIDEIIRVAKKIGASTEMVADLEEAKVKTQFSEAVDSIKHGLPQTLMVNGHNPLVLLHRALSQGIHAKTDEECLEMATSIRLVLADLANRLGEALKEHAELNAAVTKLMQK
jgi:hypothetical protein